MICSPMVNTGFSEVIGSWNTMAMPGPRIRCIRASDSSVSTWPAKRTSPVATRAGGRGSRPMTVRAVTLLPEPDSPTMPRISPASRLKVTSSTAVISPRAVWKAVVRLRTSRRLIGWDLGRNLLPLPLRAWAANRTKAEGRGWCRGRTEAFSRDNPSPRPLPQGEGEILFRSLLNPQPRIQHIT